jgi:hypothetical protein
MGLFPICILMRGHAYFAVWLNDQHYVKSMIRNLGPVWRKHAKLLELVEADDIMPLNSTTFAVSEDRPFLACREEGMRFFLDSKVFWCGVDVTLAHRSLAKPLP